jgi:hypothetical protein
MKGWWVPSKLAWASSLKNLGCSRHVLRSKLWMYAFVSTGITATAGSVTSDPAASRTRIRYPTLHRQRARPSSAARTRFASARTCARVRWHSTSQHLTAPGAPETYLATEILTGAGERNKTSISSSRAVSALPTASSPRRRGTSFERPSLDNTPEHRSEAAASSCTGRQPLT